MPFLLYIIVGLRCTRYSSLYFTFDLYSDLLHSALRTYGVRLLVPHTKTSAVETDDYHSVEQCLAEWLYKEETCPDFRIQLHHLAKRYSFYLRNYERISKEKESKMPQLVGKEVGPTGFGLMGLTWRSPPPPIDQSFKAMRASLQTSPPANFWNGGEFYGTPEFNSLHLLKQYLEKYPEDASKIVLSIKGGSIPGSLEPDGSRENVRRSVEQCLKDLDGALNKIDIFECARVDKNTPIETTMKALEELVQEGKIGAVAMSEVGEKTLRKAAKVTKIVAVEVELSLWSQEPLNNGVAKACAELGITLVAYSPIGRGMLSGAIKSPEDIPENDFRRYSPRFQPENFATNLELVKAVGAIASKKGCTPAQLALAWVRTLSKRNGNPEIIPIPGASTEERVLENSKYMTLQDSEMEALDDVVKKFEIKGGRYPKAAEAHLEG